MDFIFECKNGNIDTAKLLYNSNKKDDAFRTACKYGHVDIAKWLYALGIDIDVHEHNYYMFRRACAYGYIEIAKLLQSLGANIYVNNNVAFRHACSYGRIDIAQWLYELDANSYSRSAIKFASKNGHIDVVKWLYSIDNNNINNIIAFRWASYNKHFEIARWFCNVDPSILSNCIFSIDESILHNLDLSTDTKKILCYFMKKGCRYWFSNIQQIDEIKNAEEIDEIILHSLCIYNITAVCKFIEQKFPYITFETDEHGRIERYNIQQSNVKSARNI